MNTSKFKLLPLAFICSTSIYAEDGLTSKAELGLVYVTGNSETSSLNLVLEAKKTAGDTAHGAFFKYLRAEDTNTLTAQRFELGYAFDQKLNPKSYWGARARYESDDFSSYTYQSAFSGVAGYIFSDTEKTKLKAEGGIGYRLAELEVSGEQENEVILTAALDHHWFISKNSSWDNKLLVESGSSNTFSSINTAITSKINGSLALKFAVEFRYNSDVAVGAENLDTQTTANIVYTLK
ncbi:MAG: DUF481 domain-containing protein [bacterium]